MNQSHFDALDIQMENKRWLQTVVHLLLLSLYGYNWKYWSLLCFSYTCFSDVFLCHPNQMIGSMFEVCLSAHLFTNFRFAPQFDVNWYSTCGVHIKFCVCILWVEPSHKMIVLFTLWPWPRRTLLESWCFTDTSCFCLLVDIQQKFLWFYLTICYDSLNVLFYMQFQKNKMK